MGRASFATHLVQSRVSTATQGTLDGGGQAWRRRRLVLIQDRDRTPFRAMNLRVPRRQHQWPFPQLCTGCHAGTPCGPHQPGWRRGMVHREARHAVAAMRDGRQLLVENSVCSASGFASVPVDGKLERSGGVGNGWFYIGNRGMGMGIGIGVWQLLLGPAVTRLTIVLSPSHRRCHGATALTSWDHVCDIAPNSSWDDWGATGPYPTSRCKPVAHMWSGGWSRPCQLTEEAPSALYVPLRTAGGNAGVLVINCQD